LMELNKAAGTNDALVGATSIAFGGTLQLTNVAGTLAAGDSFQLFSAAAYSGSFSKIVPVIPALNLAWNTNTLTADGTLRIIASPTPQPKTTTITFNGSSLILAGASGVPDWPYSVLTATNPALPLSAWTPMATNRFDHAGSFAFTNVISILPQQFYL